MGTLYNIPLGEPFLAKLAEGLLARWGGDPLKIAQSMVILPTERACFEFKQVLTDAFPERAGLMPRLCTLDAFGHEFMRFFPAALQGDATKKILPEIDPYQKRFLLMHLIREWTTYSGAFTIKPADALELASKLEQLLNELEIEEVTADLVQTMFPKELSTHWEHAWNFIQIVLEQWPQILKQLGREDPIPLKRLLMDRALSFLRTNPPTFPVILAGSTGSQKATARLMDAILELTEGSVVLPGLDTGLDFLAQEALKALPSHPQHNLMNLLEILDVKMADVQPWATETSQQLLRTALMRDVMAPASLKQKSSSAELTTALQGVELVVCPGRREESNVIALIIRKALEENKSVCLVTPDRQLASFVKLLLKKWDIKAYDSAGEDEANTPEGVMLRLTARLLFNPNDLMVLKELKRIGTDLGWEMFDTSRVEIEAYSKHETKVSAQDCLYKHIKFIQTLNGPTEIFEKILPYADHLGQVTPADYEDLITVILHLEKHLEPHEGLPMVTILGPLEARLIQRDVYILGSLNEGMWPPLMDPDPWLGRDVRQGCGLRVDADKIGLSAHDFCHAFSASALYMTRADRLSGLPSTPSRWLGRLENLLKKVSLEQAVSPTHPWLDWHRESLKVGQPKMTVEPPAPTPPREARPRRLSVTEVETLIRDPYALYAKRILGLRPDESLDLDRELALKGILWHEILETFVRTYPADLPERPLDVLLEIGQEIFGRADLSHTHRQFWWAAFKQMAEWFIDTEQRRRPHIKKIWQEVRGSLTFDMEGGPFELHCIADRIELWEDGTLLIADYKTGSPPTAAAVKNGFAPQLPLEGLIAQQGGFQEIGSYPVSALSFWHLTGRDQGGEILLLRDPEDLILKAEEGILNLIQVFDHPDTPYYASPRPDQGLTYNPYAHLERSEEWMNPQ